MEKKIDIIFIERVPFAHLKGKQLLLNYVKHIIFKSVEYVQMVYYTLTRAHPMKFILPVI
jgi:hypothetical protein